MKPTLWKSCTAFAAATQLTFAVPASGDTGQKPLWELGIGIGGLALNDYRGSSAGHVYPVPVPYFAYRGTFLRADRDGIRALFLDQDYFELNISVNATTPVQSGSSGIRGGLSKLEPTLEIGPSLDLHLWRSRDDRLQLDLRMPLRESFTIDFSPRALGWSWAPRLNVDVQDVAGRTGWNLGLLFGPVFQDRGYNQYFYGVAPQFATAMRPAYQARGGYSGTQVLASISKRFPGYWIGAFLRHDFLSGAAFAGSPLLQTHDYWMGGVGIAWIVGRSATMVDVPDARP
ncbi:MAG: MipA/OmpV family protein [Steroidobacteraceae bacterium]